MKGRALAVKPSLACSAAAVLRRGAGPGWEMGRLAAWLVRHTCKLQERGKQRFHADMAPARSAAAPALLLHPASEQQACGAGAQVEPLLEKAEGR